MGGGGEGGGEGGREGTAWYVVFQEKISEYSKQGGRGGSTIYVYM